METIGSRELFPIPCT